MTTAQSAGDMLVLFAVYTYKIWKPLTIVFTCIENNEERKHFNLLHVNKKLSLENSLQMFKLVALNLKDFLVW